MDIKKNSGQFLMNCKLRKTASWSGNKILPMRQKGKQKVITVYFILIELGKAVSWSSNKI